jgi:phage-related protein
MLAGVKDVVFVGGSGHDLRSFPTVARQRAGYQIYLVQPGQTRSTGSPCPR